jgi:hypothetical protein
VSGCCVVVGFEQPQCGVNLCGQGGKKKAGRAEPDARARAPLKTHLFSHGDGFAQENGLDDKKKK